jgi:hypothetical protein
LKKYFFLFCFTLFYFIIPIHLSAQTDTTKGSDEVIINGRHYKAVEDKKVEKPSHKKHKIPIDSEFVINNQKFKYYSNWLNICGGVQQNITYQRELGFAGGVDFNFHVKREYFQIGTSITGTSVGSFNNYQLHFGYGKRFEDKDYHFAAFVGVSYSSGYGLVGDSVYTRPFNEPGLFLEGEVVKKIAFDVGFGASLFVDWNQEQSMIGCRFIVFFSGSYKGYKHKNYDNETN